jgi:predicted ATPase
MPVRMHELIAKRSRFIIAKHPLIQMTHPDADIYQIDRLGLVRTAHEETKHLLVTKAFLGKPKRKLALLLE